MSFILVDGVHIETDDDGFIMQSGDWIESFAIESAKNVGIGELSEDHWQVIHYLRNYYQQFNIAPMVRMMCKETGFSLKRIYELFPAGPGKGACKLAGLPKPTGCV